MEWIGNTAHLTNKDLELYIYGGRELLARAAEAYHEQVLLAFEGEASPTIDQVKATLADGLAVICGKILQAIAENKRFPEPDALADIFENLLMIKYECDRDAARVRAVRTVGTTDDAA